MGEGQQPTPLDRAVELLARVMDRVGLNGRRLLWKWSQRRQRLGESKLRGEILVRSATARHKMCPACRALVDRGARTCPECGASLGGVRAPGWSRVLGNALPGIGAVALVLLVNGLLFLLTLLAQLKTGGQGAGGLFSQFGFDDLARLGMGMSYMTVYQGEWWRLITPVFLHAGILHFFFNSYVLLQLGPLVEREYGPERFWLIYLLSGIAGSALSQFSHPVNTVGASGAIWGLLGTLVVYGWRSGGAMGKQIQRTMIRYGLYLLVFSLLFPGIDHLNHLGGCLGGALMGLIVPAGPARGPRAALAWQLVALAGVLLVLFAFLQVGLHGEDYRAYTG